MICGSERFYKECLKEECPTCGAVPSERCHGEPFLDRYVHLRRPPMLGGRSPTWNDHMLHDKLATGLKR